MASAWLTRMAVVPLSRMAVVAVTFAVTPPTATLSSPTVQYLRVRQVLCQNRAPACRLDLASTHGRTRASSGAGFHGHGDIAQHIVTQKHAAQSDQKTVY